MYHAQPGIEGSEPGFDASRIFARHRNLSLYRFQDLVNQVVRGGFSHPPDLSVKRLRKQRRKSPLSFDALDISIFSISYRPVAEASTHSVFAELRVREVRVCVK